MDDRSGPTAALQYLLLPHPLRAGRGGEHSSPAQGPSTARGGGGVRGRGEGGTPYPRQEGNCLGDGQARDAADVGCKCNSVYWQ